MLNNISISVLIAAKDQTLKNGKFKMSEYNRKAIQDFIDFDLTDSWMEAKDHTKLGKILASAVLIGNEIIGKPLNDKFHPELNVRMYSDIALLTANRQPHLKIKDTDTKSSIILKEYTLSRIEELKPIVDKFVAMKSKLTKNGKLPKAETERRERLQIKGKLDKKLACILEEIKREWIEIIYKNEFEWMCRISLSVPIDFINKLNNAQLITKEEKERVVFLMNHQIISRNNDGYVINNHDTISKISRQIAENEGESFYFKMADKLGGLVTGKYEFTKASHSTGGKTPFTSYIKFEFANNTQFIVKNNIVVNTSPLGNSFYQYPCTFHDVMINGEKLINVSEYTVKLTFKND